MTVTLPSTVPVLPDLETKPADVGRVLTELRRVANDVAEVQDWAERRSADGAHWTGDAGEAADHESTRFSRLLAMPEAALFGAAGAAEDLELQLVALEKDRAELERQRIVLNDAVAQLAADVAAAGPAADLFFKGLGLRAAALTAHARDLAEQNLAWMARVETAERTFIRALDLLDTTAEAAQAIPAVQSQEVARQQVRDVVEGLIAAGVVPAVVRGMNARQLRDFLTANPDVAHRIVVNEPRAGAQGLEGLIAAGLSRSAARALFTSMREADARVLAQLYPDELGNRSGVPFAYRAEANRVRILNQLDGFGQMNPDEIPERSAEVMRTYQSLIDEDRNVVVFSPSRGAIVEIHGQIDASTKDVGVIVPGTFTDPSNFNTLAARADSFARAQGDGSLATVSWMGGEFPPDLVAAGSSRYADDLGPRLAEFSRDLRQELGQVGASGAHTTYVGHSYGGAVVGTAELSGLDADRVLHLESAGMGHGVGGPGDLPSSQRDVQRYSMTAPGDLVGSAQGMPGGHGADPDEFDGTTHLHTGRYADGGKVSGNASHSRVFDLGSDPWKQTFEVMTGGTVTTHVPAVPLGPGGPPPPGGRPAVGGERIDIP